MAKNNVRQMTVVRCGHSTVDAVAENFWSSIFSCHIIPKICSSVVSVRILYH